jgi:ABC-type transporter Mla subunit MlaD
LQNAAQTMAAAIQNTDDILNKFSAEISKYAAQVNDEIQEYNSNLQKDIAKYSWYEKQYAAIDARYKEQIQTLQGVL